MTVHLRNFYRDFCEDYTIVHALNSRRLAEESRRYANLTWEEGVKLGFAAGVQSVIRGCVVISAIHAIFKHVMDQSNKKPGSDLDFIQSGFFYPIIEEITFRKGLQNLISYLQRSVCYLIALVVHARCIPWLLSPTCTIIASNLLFALAHLPNGGDYLSSAGAATQAVRIFLCPVEAILYQTTGTLAAPLAAHMTNNLFFSL